ncbi:hypothetical protein JY651_13250 [Pyxidicoccus parkwayensis]|uniref:Ig-like domain-containing protein n=1 Tax=Pyxidicoccus parkwayensis TaxID=2813578 RepID=A0ABX7P5X8_9BACT|nr:hypothetical protein [Pyxidicoccus parkwaysis]QSQ25830.1 hypothetical protein JY651_13250 [Pyxidicoccus parkwaysis]
MISTTLTIKNDSGCPIDNRGTPNNKDGHIEGSAPATSIASGSSTTFDVQQNNSLSPGPEGSVTYSLETGNEQVPLTFNWMYSSGPNHPESYSGTSGLSCVSVSNQTTDGSGDHHAVTYTVTLTPRAPNEWDMVWALSVGLIDKQLHDLQYYGLIPSHFTQPLSSSDTWSQLAVTTMAAPTVQVPDDATTHLDVYLPFTTATLQYLENGQQKSQTLSGDTVIVSLDLSQVQVTDASTLAATSDAKQHLQGLMSLNYGVYRLFVDLTQPALFRSLRVVNTASGAAVSLSSAAQSTLQSTLAALKQMDVAYTVKAPGKPASIEPTLAVPRTTRYATNGDFSTLNICMMTRGRSEPTWSSRYAFKAPMAATTNPDGTPATAMARMYLSQDALGEGYLAPTVLPAILNASGITKGTSIKRTAPLRYQCSATQNNGNLNGGRGVFVQVNNGFDQYVYGTESIVFQTQPTTQAGQVVISLTGQFKVVADVSQYPLDTLGISMKNHLGTATFVQPWTGTITLSAGDGGQLVTAVSVTLGQAPAPDIDKSISGWVFNALDALFNWTTTTPQSGITQKVQDFATSLANTFRDNAALAMDASDCVVLPTGAPYYYSELAFNSDGAVQIDVSFRG